MKESYFKIKEILFGEISWNTSLQKVPCPELKNAYLNFIRTATPSSFIPLSDIAKILLGRSSFLQIVTINKEKHTSSSAKSIALNDSILRSIKSKKLEVFKVQTSCITENNYSPLKVLKFGDVLLWAIQEKHKLADELLEVLGIFQPFDGKKQKFNPQQTTLQSAAQFVWYHKPYATIENLKTDPLILSFCPTKGYKNIKTLRDIVKEVDPRPLDSRTKPKKSKLQNQSEPFACKPIPRLLVEENNKKLIDLRKLAVVCQTIRNCENRSSLKLPFDSTENHPLIGMYIQDSPPLIKSLICELLRNP